MERRTVGWSVAVVEKVWWVEEGGALDVWAPSEVVQSQVRLVAAPSEMTQQV